MSVYVVSGATLKCNQGDQTSTLQVGSDRKVSCNGKAMVNIMDAVSQKNIMPFGQCKSMSNPTVAAATAVNEGRLQKMPCVPVIIPPWKGGKTDVMVDGSAVLVDSSFALCQWCGQIKIQKTGQDKEFVTDGAVAAKAEKAEKETKEKAKTLTIKHNMKQDFQTLAQLQQEGDPQAKSFEDDVKEYYEGFLQPKKDPGGGVAVIGLRGWGVGTPCHNTAKIKGERNTYNDMFAVINQKGRLSVFSRCNFEGTTATGTYGDGKTLNGKYPKIANGSYELNATIHSGYRALTLNNDGKVPTIGENPRFPRRGNPGYSTGVHIHKGGRDWTWSEGCLTIYAPDKSDSSRWNRFIANFPNIAAGIRVGLLTLLTM